MEISQGTYSILIDGRPNEVRVQVAETGLRIFAAGQESQPKCSILARGEPARRSA